MCFRLFSKFRGGGGGAGLPGVPEKLQMEFSKAFSPGTDTTSEVLTEQNHPLLSRLIMIRILSHLDAESLKGCRGTCQVWNKVALCLLPHQTEFDCRKMSPEDMDGALAALAKDLCLLPTSFVYSVAGLHFGTCQKFMKYYGHRLHSLRLRPWSHSDVFGCEEFANLFYQCPYLQSLSLSAIPNELAMSPQLFYDSDEGSTSSENISSKSFQGIAIESRSKIHRFGSKKPIFSRMTSLTLYGGSEYSIGFLCDLFTVMPNLSKFTVQEPTAKFLGQIFWILKNPKYTFPELETLEIIRPLELVNDHLIRLELCAFRLKVLKLTHLQMTHNVIGKIYLEPILQTLAFTLEELTLPALLAGSERTISTHTVSVPKMLKLRKLELEDWKLFGPLSFVKNCLPKLSILSIEDRSAVENYGDDQVPIILPFHVAPHFKLKHLSLPYNFHDEDDLERILEAFPGLKRLKLFVTDVILGVIYKYGKQLEEIHCFPNSLATDTGITGIPKKYCDLLKHDHTKMVKKRGREIAWKKTKDSIHELTGLKRLTLACAGKRFLTDISITHGLKDLKNLTNLTLRNCVVSDHSLVALTHLPLLQLDLGSLDDTTITTMGIHFFKNQKPFTHLIYNDKTPAEN